ncbi:MAG: type IIA DNA topoisomerase subunit B [Candidatus Dadabacteria bacterium]|nr:MAG: type IIA DNA topoisomerase subunit B [Candidatus Dadabacteria bacterium]
MAGSTYRAKDIEVLEGLEPVRKRPGMYIGGTEGLAGLHHLVKEIVDNAVDEAMNGHATTISVTLHKDKRSITVEDDGRGIPVDKHPKFKKPALEIIMTTLHAGGKFSDRNYASAGGLHGVGASVVNALSERMEVVVKRDGYTWSQSFERGVAKTKLTRGKKTKEHGTSITFTPDPEIFKSVEFSDKKLREFLQEKAFLNKGLKVVYRDEYAGREECFYYEDGLKAYLQHLLKRHSLKAIRDETFDLERSNGIRVEMAFCWTESTRQVILSYVNGICTADGGSHEDGFKSGLAKAIRNYANVHEAIPRGVKLTGDDIREGLVAVVSVNVPGALSQLQFQGQTKDRLNNPEIVTPVEGLARTFENTLNSRPSTAAAIMERVILAARARSAARAASQSVSRKVGVSHRLNLPGKLADCSSTRPSDSELFIVEGDSAGGSAKQGRDRKTQAVLPLRGKILNTVSAPESKLKENKEIADIVSAIGCGLGANINLKKIRYGKIIILTDADADGMHIASLLMAFFFRFMRPLVDAGHLYLGLPPLYRIRVGSGSKIETIWVYSEQEKEDYLKKRGSNRNIQITRFKGLGEMNPDTLWKTTLNPRTRNLLQIHVEDEAEVVEMFQALMGRDSSKRYELIRENAERLEVDL